MEDMGESQQETKKSKKGGFKAFSILLVILIAAGGYGAAYYYFQQSVDLNNKWWTSYNNLGVCKESEGKLEDAAVLYKTAIDNGQYYLAYENYAKVLVKQKKYDEAKEFIEETLKYFPENITLQVLLQQLVSQ